MATPFWGLPTTTELTNNVTPYTAEMFSRDSKILESQLAGALDVFGAGVVKRPANALQVAAAVGLNVSIVAGLAIARHSSRGPCFLRYVGTASFGPLAANRGAENPLYIHLRAEKSGNIDSLTDATPVLLVSDLDSVDGAVLIAAVQTSGSAIASVDNTVKEYIELGGAGAGSGFNPRGAWAATTAYAVDDIVTHDGRTYRVATAHTSPASFSTSNLELWADKGATGAQGPQGATGAQGPQGPAGDAGLSVDTIAALAGTSAPSGTNRFVTADTLAIAPGAAANEVKLLTWTNADPNAKVALREADGAWSTDFSLGDFITGSTLDEAALRNAVKSRLDTAFSPRTATVTTHTTFTLDAGTWDGVLQVTFDGNEDLPVIQIRGGAIHSNTVSGGDGDADYSFNGGATFTLPITESALQTNQRALGGQFAGVVIDGTSSGPSVIVSGAGRSSSNGTYFAAGNLSLSVTDAVLAGAPYYTKAGFVEGDDFIVKHNNNAYWYIFSGPFNSATARYYGPTPGGSTPPLEQWELSGGGTNPAPLLTGGATSASFKSYFPTSATPPAPSHTGTGAASSVALAAGTPAYLVPSTTTQGSEGGRDGLLSSEGAGALETLIEYEAVLRKRAGNKFAFLGDSITAGETTTNSLSQERGVAWPSLAAGLLGDKIEMVRNAGIPGNTTAQMLARIQTDVVAYNPDWVVVAGGTNDVGQNTPIPLETTRTNLTAIYEALNALGINVVFCTPPPRTGATTAQKLAQSRLTAWIRGFCFANGLPCIDMFSEMADLSTGDWKTNFSDDGIHPTRLGQVALARSFDAQMRPYFEAPVPSLLVPESFASGESANLLPSFWADANADGKPDVWFGYGDLVVTETLETVDGRRWFNIETTGAANGRFLEVDVLAANFAPGDWVYFGARAKWTGHANLEFLFDVTVTGHGKFRPASDWNYLGLTEEMVLHGRFQMPASAIIKVTFGVIGSGAGDGELSIAEPTLLNLTALGL